jgi:hypothetical protein
MAKVKDLGVAWLRTDAYMGNYPSTTFLDDTLTAAQTAGLHVLVTMTYTWSANGGKFNDPTDHTAWANYAGTLVDHWNASFPGVIGAYEIWNEANGIYFENAGNTANAGPAEYEDLLKVTYAVLKPKVGSALILSTGTAVSGISASDWLSSVYAANGGSSANLFDAVAHHPYNSGANDVVDNSGSGYRETAQLRQVMNANGDSNKQIWGTEAGWPSCYPSGGGNIMTEATRATRFDGDMKDWFYGLHDANGAPTGQFSTTGDWNTAAWMIFKLYKNGDGSFGTTHDDGVEAFGLIYTGNTCTDGSTPSSMGYEPPVVGELRSFAASLQSSIGP